MLGMIGDRAARRNRPLGDLTDAELREIELEENLRRKDLTPFERNKTLVTLAETAAQIAKESKPHLVPESGTKSRGRPIVPSSDKAVAEKIGVPRATLQEAKAHVETAEAFPFMQKPDWKQYHVLEAKEVIEKRILAAELNIARRQLSDAQKVMVGRAIEPDVSERARLRQVSLAGTRKDAAEPSGQMSVRSETRDEVARTVGLGSGRTYERHKHADGPPRGGRRRAGALGHSVGVVSSWGSTVSRY